MAKILTVDDAAFVRRWCVSVLSRAGHDVIEAKDGAEAVRLYLQHRPDAVLLDVLMPNKGGLDVLKELRDHDPHVRVAMLTTQAYLDVVQEAVRLGARGFLVKPCGAEPLLDAVRRILA